jgi:hypothetical protein
VKLKANILKHKLPIDLWLVSLIALIFGLLTIYSGGLVLFVDGVAREGAGNYVPFVLWFNFVAGFIYILAAIGLLLQRAWAAWLSISIVLFTLIVFVLLGVHALNGGLLEDRTIAAMSLRSIVWGGISAFSYWKFIRV